MVVDVDSLLFFSCISFGDRIGIGDSVSDRLLSFIVLSFMLLVLLLLLVVIVVLSFIL